MEDCVDHLDNCQFCPKGLREMLDMEFMPTKEWKSNIERDAARARGDLCSQSWRLAAFVSEDYKARLQSIAAHGYSTGDFRVDATFFDRRKGQQDCTPQEIALGVELVPPGRPAWFYAPDYVQYAAAATVVCKVEDQQPCVSDQ